MYGFLTRQRYEYECVFVDHQYDFTYIHLLKVHTVDELFESKEAFKEYAESRGVNINHYHAENNVSQGAKWTNHCKGMHPVLTFTGVNAHHKNG